MPALVEYLQMAGDDERKKEALRCQWTDAIEENKITCVCGQLRALVMAYRCLYCGIFFCQPCAEVHFGQTVREYYAAKAKKPTCHRSIPPDVLPNHSD